MGQYTEEKIREKIKELETLQSKGNLDGQGEDELESLYMDLETM